MTDTILPPVARPNYFTGEALLTEDFICEQAFHSGSLAAVNGTLHTYGVASGLGVEWFRDSQPRQVHVSPGMAIDRMGRQIVLAQPLLVLLEDVTAGAVYYLTISFAEVYGELTDETGVLGYKRVIQQPRIGYDRTLRDAGLDILLAVLTLTNEATIATLAYRAGRDERRYVGGRFGSLGLVTEGAGISTGGGSSFSPPPADVAVQLAARRETDGSGNSYLAIDADRSQFAGPLTTRAAIGIGLDHPTAHLDVATVTFKGRGTFTTKAKLLTLSNPVAPPLQPGDRFFPDISAALNPASPRFVTIVAMLPASNGCTYQIDQAFAADFTRATRFTYVLNTLVRVTDPDSGNLLQIDRGGALNLGVRAAPAPGTTDPGPGALSITADRRVGIGLTGSVRPQASLQVAGGIVTDAITTDSLLSTGRVTARSFSGNGSGLTDLSFLSYWTKVDVANANSPIYYDEGNVGIHMTRPPATLSAGTRGGFVGSGLISTDPTQPATVTGTQTAFLTEIVAGVDSITLGSLVQQRRVIVAIDSDTQLTLAGQFSIIVEKSLYMSLPASGEGTPQPGAGKISSSGAVITGVGTNFLGLAVGDLLLIDAVTPFKDQLATRLVVNVKSDTELTLQDLAVGETWEANVSAFIVSSGLMGCFQANGVGPLTTDLPVPALLVHNNGLDGSANAVPNTVAINVPLKQIDTSYALQVVGPFSQGGGAASFSDLTVTQSLTVSGDGKADDLLTVGEAGAVPLLTVTKTNVEVTALPGATSPVLSVTGDLSATGTVTGATVTGTGVTSTGAMTCGGTLASHSSALLGIRTVESLTGNSFTSEAMPTDGFVVILLGTIATGFDVQFASMVSVTTSLNGTVSSTAATAASTQPYYVANGKKEGDLYYLPIFGSLTVPVQKNEVWSLIKTDPPSSFGVLAADLIFYWIPLGSGGADATGVANGTPPAFQDLHDRLAVQRSNILAGTMAGSVTGDSIAIAQANIDARMSDLTRILGDATSMDAAPDARATFQRDLATIVCRAGSPLRDPEPAADTAIQTLIDTFASVTDRTFTKPQRTLLAAGVRALVEINANSANRKDLDLIRSNIGLFIDNIEKVLKTTFVAGQRRLLIRALVRLVGDGSRTLPEAGGDPAPGAS